MNIKDYKSQYEIKYFKTKPITRNCLPWAQTVAKMTKEQTNNFII